MKYSGQEAFLINAAEKIHHLFDEVRVGQELPAHIVPPRGRVKRSEQDGNDVEVALVARVESFELKYTKIEEGVYDIDMKIGTLLFDTMEMVEMFAMNEGYETFIDFMKVITKPSPEQGRITKQLGWFIDDRYDYHEPES